MNTHTIILAAGKGTRMNTNLPKVMQLLGGKSLIEHVINTAQEISNKVTVVVGHQKDLLKEHLAEIDPNIVTVNQENQHGTAHAVKTASHLIQDDEKVLILYGDVPLISNNTIQSLLNSENKCTLLSMTLSDPTGYGRVLFNERKPSFKDY